MELKIYYDEAELEMNDALTNYENNLAKISTGRANPKIFDHIKVLYYGEFMPLNQVCAISVPESRQFLIKPFDPSIIKEVVGAINGAHMGIVAVNEGEKARITIPELTTERRKELVKQMAKYTEEARVAIRLARQKINKDIKADVDLPEDDLHTYLDEIQALTNKYNERVEAIGQVKEQELTTI